MTMPESVIEGKLITDTLVKRFHGRSRARELHLYNLKVDYISNSTTNIESSQDGKCDVFLQTVHQGSLLFYL